MVVDIAFKKLGIVPPTFLNEITKDRKITKLYLTGTSPSINISDPLWLLTGEI